MIGQTLGHYHFTEKIGAGGMGQVYRARDEHLNRDVAVKVLPADTLADEQARKRFRREAEALSKLNHPHIATVHDFDTQDGVDFIVMELVAGEALDDRLKTGPLPEKVISRLGEQTASALEEAHEHGIIHRDLKPANIRLTPKGQVKILDFGIARLRQPAGVEATTQSFAETQVLAGTLPYMSPEQLRGEPVDARSDLYSFGVVLFEMATGERPFQEKLPTALSDAILHQAPPAPRTVNHRVSAGLENIILKCLEKEPENRYQSAKELGVDLRRLGSRLPQVTAQPRASGVTGFRYVALIQTLYLLPIVLGVVMFSVIIEELLAYLENRPLFEKVTFAIIGGAYLAGYFISGMTAVEMWRGDRQSIQAFCRWFWMYLLIDLLGVLVLLALLLRYANFVGALLSLPILVYFPFYQRRLAQDILKRV